MTNIEKKTFALKLAAKRIARNAKKSKKEEAKEMEKCWRRVMRGELDVGRVHAENAVRNRNQSIGWLTLGARLDGTVNVLRAAVAQNQVTSAMKSVVLSMASATRDMDLRTLTSTMGRFERMTEHLNVRQAYANETLDDGAGADQVGLLVARIADRVGLDVRNEMPATARGSRTELVSARSLPSLSAAAPTATGLDGRLAKLGNDYVDENDTPSRDDRQ